MNILIACPSDVNDKNGTSMRAMNIFDSLKFRYDVSMMSSKNSNFTNLWFFFRLSVISWHINLIKTIILEKPSYLYSCSDFTGTFIILLFSKLFKTKIIFESHGILSEENVEKGRSIFIVKMCKIIEAFVIRRSDSVIVLSNNIKDFYKKYNNNIVVVPTLINLGNYPLLTDKSKDIKTVGIIGPFNMPANRYQLDFLYEYIGVFDNKINFLIIGKCSNRINNNRINYTGYLENQEEYIEKLSSLNALLIISEISTSGPLTKILEAMACGVPVISTKKAIKGLDRVKNFYNILYFDNEKDLIEQVNDMIFNEKLMRTISNNGINLIKSYYNKELNKKKIYDIIDNISGSLDEN